MNNLQTIRDSSNSEKDDTTYILSDNDCDDADADTHSDEFDDENSSSNSNSNSNSVSKSYRSDNTPQSTRSRKQSFYDAKIQDQYHMMISMTLELVRDMTFVRKNDEVLTAYGKGVMISRQQNGSMEIKLPFGKLYHRQPEMVHKIISPSEYEQAMEHLEQVRKLGLTTQSQQWNVPIVEEACVACLFDRPFCKTGKEKTWVMENNANINIASQDVHAKQKSATAIANAKNKNRRSWFGRLTSASTATSNLKSAAPLVKERNGMLKKNKKLTRTKFCDVCGNPVCSKHIIPSQSQQFRMCADCEFDFSQMFETTSSDKMTQGGGGINSNLLDLDHIPQLTQTLDRLLTYYTRMSLHLTFCAPNMRELADRLTAKERTNSRIVLGAGGISFVGAALGVAGAAALLTPAGPALLLAAVATSASSAAIQGGHSGYNALFNMSLKEANQLADRILGWHGLCLGILDALEQLRQTLLQQVLAIAANAKEVPAVTLNVNGTSSNTNGNGNTLADSGRCDSINSKMNMNSNANASDTGDSSSENSSDDGNCNGEEENGNQNESETAATTTAANKKRNQQEKDALLLRQVLNSRTLNTNKKSTSEQSLEVLNTLALGTYHTTRNGLTGVVSLVLSCLCRGFFGYLVFTFSIAVWMFMTVAFDYIASRLKFATTRSLFLSPQPHFLSIVSVLLHRCDTFVRTYLHTTRVGSNCFDGSIVFSNDQRFHSNGPRCRRSLFAWMHGDGRVQYCNYPAKTTKTGFQGSSPAPGRNFFPGAHTRYNQIRSRSLVGCNQRIEGTAGRSTTQSTTRLDRTRVARIE